MGPLQGFRIVEIAALGPAPLAGMILADLGAEVIRIERQRVADEKPLFDPQLDILTRSRRTLTLNLKCPEDLEALLALIRHCDGLIEGFRPGVMEKLGLGPEVCLTHNPRLVYGRMTGWGQTGPLAQRAGHDINYLSLTGALAAIGEREGPPVVPLNLVADGGGGAMLLVTGMLAGLLEASRSGLGQVVDCAMTEGSSILMAMIHTWKAMGQWQEKRGGNLIDGAAPFYTTYPCQDGRYLAVGCLEPQFYRAFVDGLGLQENTLTHTPSDPECWLALKQLFGSVLLTRSRDAWVAHFAQTDACVTPVLTMSEAAKNSHLADRHAFCIHNDIVQPAPAPRFSRSHERPPQLSIRSEDNKAWLEALGLENYLIRRLVAKGSSL